MAKSLSTAIAVFALVAACRSDVNAQVQDAAVDAQASVDATANPDVGAGDAVTSWAYPMGFFYQTVGLQNQVRVGWTHDGTTVTSSGSDYALSWGVIGKNVTWADPVMSYLKNGTYATTAGTFDQDPRGAAMFMYHETTCPRSGPAPEAAAVKVITPKSHASDALCKQTDNVVGGKGSRIFDIDGSNYMFISNQGTMYLLRMTNGSSTGSPDAMCFLETAVTKVSSLRVGDATPVVPIGTVGAVASGTDGLVFGDAGIMRRTDGTWVLIMKGFPKTLADGHQCHDLCELCNRGIYRATSKDLLTWSAIDRIAFRASVPEAAVDPTGRPWVYYQDFGAACDAQNLQLAGRAHISAISELDLSGTMSTPTHVVFTGQSFEKDEQEHYPTNGNPVMLSGPDAFSQLQSCKP